MRIDVALSPAEYSVKVPAARRAVLIDLIRATTTIVVAFETGCAAVIPAGTPEESRALRAGPEGRGALLCGERGGLRIPDFDLGNSPREVAGAPLAGRRLILCTSNGTRALAALAPIPEVWIGTLRNVAAVAHTLAKGSGDVLLACSGKDGLFCLEDAVCAGAIVHALRSAAGQPLHLSDGASATEVLFHHYRRDLLGMLHGTEWGRRLATMGFGEDLRFCAALDAAAISPVFRHGLITL